MVADHLSILPFVDDNTYLILDEMIEKTLMETMVIAKAPWFADIADLLTCGVFLEFESRAMKKAFYGKVANFFWDDPYLFHYCSDSKRRVPKILTHCHTYARGGHHGVDSHS